MKEGILKDLPSLETARLILRRLEMSDAEEIYDFASRKETSEFLTWEPHASISVTESFLSGVIERYKKGDIAQWGMLHKEDGKIIGITGFGIYDPVNAKAEIASVLSPDYWHTGLTSEALDEVHRFGFEEMGLVRIEAKVRKGYAAPANMILKMGFSLEGTLRKYALIKGEHWDFNIFSLLREEYEGIRSHGE
jgi:ribosomal-protein-alanine N-acetyltransferase